MGEDLRGKLMSWFVDEGFEVKKMEVPPQAPLEWSMLVTVKAPLQVNIAVQKPSNIPKIVLSMGVKLAPHHQNAFNSLAEPERLELRAELVESLLHLCPDCVVIPQPPGSTAMEGMLVSREVPLYTREAEGILRREVMTTCRVLSNAYQIIVERLNARLGTGAGPRQDTMVM
ncbi:MAG: DUF2299 domain-containing protein [Desulfurococcales archaeon]|nr:DUF2299 domain-containing protein [Desulfurococcales archaeon]